eukprot:gene27668-7308_t
MASVQRAGSALLAFSRSYLRSSESVAPWLLGSRYNSSDAAPAKVGIPYGELSIGVPKESASGEKRVGLSPAAVALLLKSGFKSVMVEKSAGEPAKFMDSEYEKVGAKVVDGATAFSQDIVIKVSPVSLAEVGKLKDKAKMISYLYPARNKEVLEALSKRQATAWGMDCIPRTISRAQMFDTLSSMSNISGYKAVAEAAHHYEHFFCGQITAAGRIPPAKVLIIGGGVAGLIAGSMAKNMGAVVRLFDTRNAVREQAKSLGAEFLTVDIKEEGESGTGYSKEMSKAFIDAEMKLFADQCKEVDIIITTALIPGRTAPVLIKKEFVESMKPGSVIVDLASEAGGNCELTKPGELFKTANGVTILGYTDMPSRMATQASLLYSNNVTKYLLSMGPFSTGKKGEFLVDHSDIAVRGALVLEDGNMMWPPPPNKNAVPGLPAKKEVKKVEPVPIDYKAITKENALVTTGAFGGMLLMGAVSPNPAFTAMMTKFGLASICGYQTVWGVTPALHSPLMSVTNAISGLTAVGGMMMAGGGLLPHTTAQTLAFVAMLTSAVNIGGGFTITQRMLDMFRRPGDPAEFNQMYAIPAVALMGGVLMGNLVGLTEVTNAAYLAATIACISSIGCLANQKTASLGNTLGMLGVGSGIVATLGALHGVPVSVYVQIIAALGIGGAGGRYLATLMKITDLPQMVAAFHALVGLAALTTSMPCLPLSCCLCF